MSEMHITSSTSTVQGVEFKVLETRADHRGFFREIIRDTDPFFKGSFGQWSHSLMYERVTKAWHMHRIQTDWWYVATGVLRVALCDMRESSPTHLQKLEFRMGDHQSAQVVKIPPGVAHGCQTLQGPVHLFYVTSHVYNPDDEIRISHDDSKIDFDWTSGPAIT